MKHAFHRALKRFLVSAFSTEKLSPENVSAMLSRAIHRPCGAIYRKEIEKILTERGIQDLVHFTPIQNVSAICKYGLIPRDYLNCEVLKLALGPHFPDVHRLDGATEFNCLSITSPNYKMLYSKRHSAAQNCTLFRRKLQHSFFEAALDSDSSFERTAQCCFIGKFEV